MTETLQCLVRFAFRYGLSDSFRLLYFHNNDRIILINLQHVFLPPKCQVGIYQGQKLEIKNGKTEKICHKKLAVSFSSILVFKVLVSRLESTLEPLLFSFGFSTPNCGVGVTLFLIGLLELFNGFWVSSATLRFFGSLICSQV